MEPIAELLVILSDHELEGESLASAVTDVLNASGNPDLAWLKDSPRLREFAIYDQLFEYVAQGDKLDELHDRLSDLFGEPLPPFPFETAESSSRSYFLWLGGVLSERGYAAASIDPGVDDELRILPIDASDTQRLSELAQLLSLRIRVEDGNELLRNATTREA